MILTDPPESPPLILPGDNLTTRERVHRLFSGMDGRWRLLAVLTLNSGPSDLVKHELKDLAEIFGPSGLAIRLVFISDIRPDALDRELARWNDEHIIATGDNIHARRFLDGPQTVLPTLKLFDPEGDLHMEIAGFDTEHGLDGIARVLEQSGTNVPETDVLSEGLK